MYQLVGLLRGRAGHVGRRNALAVMDCERRLAIDLEARVQRAFLRYPVALACCSLLYAANQVVITPTVLWLLHRSDPGHCRLVRRRLLLAVAAASIWHAVQPVTPPRSMSIGIVDTVSQRTPLKLDSQLVRSLYNPTAAMPSLHVATALLTSSAVREASRSRCTRTAAAVYPALVGVSVIATGNHFVLDIAGGTALAAGTTLAVRQGVSCRKVDRCR